MIAEHYFPAPDPAWETIRPEAAGFNPVLLRNAIDFAIANETEWTRDHARFGYLMLRRGRWNGRQLLSERWIDLATTPSIPNPGYGYLFWLNSNQAILPSMPKSSFLALGAGSNIVCMDPVHDIVVVVRWMVRERIDAFFKQILAALGE